MSPIRFNVTVGEKTYEAFLESDSPDEVRRTLGLEEDGEPNLTTQLASEVGQAALARYGQDLGHFLETQLAANEGLQRAVARGDRDALAGAKITSEGIELVSGAPVEEELQAAEAEQRPMDRTFRWVSIDDTEMLASLPHREQLRRLDLWIREHLRWRPLTPSVEFGSDGGVHRDQAARLAEQRRLSLRPQPAPGADDPDGARGGEL